MTETAPKIRLYVDAVLSAGAAVPLLPDQAHYLFAVMRRAEGDSVALFNGRDGEWRAEIAQAGNRRGLLMVLKQTRAQVPLADLWLLCAPIRKARMDILVEKAVELGVARLQPVLTRRSQSERLRPEKMRAHMVEAAEQCGSTVVPELVAAQPLAEVLAGWPADRRLLFCDETRDAPSMAGLNAPPPAALLIGPEGGFDPGEAAALRGHPACQPVSLGPRILRAETAAIAAIALWQALQGDWR
ncbi:MAG: 16S rRNA (uracil(1498)-N(3))-methyltransferase [Pseudomonadota bacterium]